MDEYLSEKEQLQRIRQWWNENGWFLVGGVALGALLLAGWNQYQSYQARRAEQAAGLYETLKQSIADQAGDSDSTASLAQLREDHPSSAYTDQAGLLVARMYLVRSEPELAAAELRFVMEHTRDNELSLIARLRLARVLAYREQYDEALQALAIRDPGRFAGRFSEVRGDVHAALGEADAARAAYRDALTAPGDELLDRSFLQMKLNDLEMPDAADDHGGGA